MDPSTLMLLILLTPLVSAGLIACFMRQQGTPSAVLSVLAAFGIVAFSLMLLFGWDGNPIHVSKTWFDLAGLEISLGFLFNEQTATMLLVVSVVSFLIHVFSYGYMKDDSSKARYFAGLSIFMFSMLGIVLADNLIMIFIFWELVGFSSYALIAHYKDTKEATDASKKAFIVNRIGDFGFLVGIVWAYWHFGTVDLVELSSLTATNPQLISSGIAALLVCGFIGKSAQFPLQVWLPDAMAGPTPVSALIHAATMVAAGIYFLVRIFFLLPEDVLTLILWLGAAMTAYAGFCALGQRDIKKILAYSTLSQLGYMATAVGLGYPGIALFHLGTHACFKALLFLGSGSVIHSLHHEQDIFKMGGLLKRMPVTTFTFGVGLLALCGVTYTSGYFSKDAIIEASYFSGMPVFALICFSAFLTSLYMGRLFWVAFLGQPNSKHAEDAHESPWVMTLPLVVLAVFSLIAGYVTLWPTTWSASFVTELERVHELVHDAHLGMMMLVLTTAAWVVGLALSYVFYRPGASEDNLEKRMPALYNLFKSKLWFDELYNYYVANIQQRFASLLSFLDMVVISGLFVRGTGGFFGLVGVLSRSAHVGNLQTYLYWFLLGVFLFTTFAFVL